MVCGWRMREAGVFASFGHVPPLPLLFPEPVTGGDTVGRQSFILITPEVEFIGTREVEFMG